MKNDNLIKRILTCVVAIPILFGIIFYLPQRHNIGLRIFVTLLALLGSIEMSKMLFSKVTLLSVLSWLMPLACFANELYADFLLAVFIISALALEVKEGENDNFHFSINNIGKRLLLIVYPSYLLTYPIRLTSLDISNSYLITYYVIMIFSNDTFAYVFGMLFGKDSNAGLKASPKKSYAGFIGGFISTIVISYLFSGILKDKCILFDNNYFRFICPALLALLADIGDLAESVIKRSANVKDSSHLFPGHGGVLDRVDSIVSTIPIFYLLVRFFI